MLKYIKINNELLRVGRTAIARTPFEGSPRAGTAEYVHRGVMLITPYFDKEI